MKKKKHNSARIILTAFAVLTLAAGCGKKKVEDYFVEEDVVAIGDSVLARNLSIPVSYTGNFEVKDAPFNSISIDAEKIDIPDVDYMSQICCNVVVQDEDYKQQIISDIFGKDAVVEIYSDDYNTESAKDIMYDIEEETRSKNYYTNIGDTEGAENVQQRIDKLNERLKTAPENRTINTNYSSNSYIGVIDEQEYLLTFSTSDTGLGIYYELEPYPGLWKFRPGSEDCPMTFVSDGGEISDTDNTNSAEMSVEDAELQARDFLSKCGITDITLETVSNLRWTYAMVDDEIDGYMFTFIRAVNGVTVDNANMMCVDNLHDKSSGEYPYIKYETYQVSICDKGIVQAICYDMLSENEESVDRAELLSWQDILSSLENEIADYYNTYPTAYKDITFSNVQLTYYRIEAEDNENKYYYEPAWIFTEYETSEAVLEEYPIYATCPMQMLVIDAVTGNVIDIKAEADKANNGETPGWM
jgi:hypothetical protein